jgi:hypothetical protein
VSKTSSSGTPGLISRVTAAGTEAVRPLVRFTLRHWIRHDELVRIRQQMRYLGYNALLTRQAEASRDLTLYELSVFSQNGEDGVLQEIFRRIGTTNGYFIEIGASPNESNTVLLADAFGWQGTIIDASESESSGLTTKYASSDRVVVARAFVDASNINGLLDSEDIPTVPDLFSLDIDGNDYWVWSALEVIRPRVVVIEYNSHVPPDLEAVQPNEPTRAWNGTSFFGASLASFRSLASAKGYRLVHCDTSGINLIFVDKSTLGPDTDFLPEAEVISRVPNYYLYGLRHPDPAEGEPGHYVNFTVTEEGP